MPAGSGTGSVAFPQGGSTRRRVEGISAALILLAMLAGFFLVSRRNYLLFHSLAEGFSIMALVGIFMVVWHSRRFLENGYLICVGLGALFVAWLDLLHTLSYRGTGVFPGHGTNLPTQLWIAARSFQAAVLLIAPVCSGNRLRREWVLTGMGAVAAIVTAAIFHGRFPVCFIEGTGLTPFKIGSELVIVTGLFASIFLLLGIRDEFEPDVLGWLVLSIAITAASELLFTGYHDPYGAFNLAGHMLRISASFLLYKAVIETAFLRPHALLFRSLARSEVALREDNAKLLELQDRLSAMNEDLRRLNERKNEFVGMAAHDLRTPLSIVSWYSDLLLDDPPRLTPDQQREFLARIRRTAEFMLQLVDDLLSITEIEAGKLKLAAHVTDLGRLVERNISLNRILAERKKMALVFREGKGPLLANVDPARVEQLLNNLISNAIKYSPPGSRIEVDLAAMGGWIVLAVRDEGPGIARDDFNRIFQAFGRGTSKATGGEKSTGLGLAIAKRIVDAHGGKIEVQSEEGRGTVFIVRFSETAG